MGQSTFVRSAPAAANTLPKPRRFKLEMDIWLTVIIFTLLLVGLMFVYSASWKFSLQKYHDINYILFNQLKFVVGGIFMVIIMSFFKYRWYKKLLLPMVAITLAALVYVKFFGETRNNANRTLFGGSVQPSEFAMLVVVIYLSFWLVSKKDVLNQITFGLLPMGAILGVFAALIILQPDYSATLTIVLLGTLLFILIGAEFKQILILLVVESFAALIIFTLTSTGKLRMDQFIGGLISPTLASEHLQYAMWAIRSGGWFGAGIGLGTAKFSGLPVPWTDSIFAVIIEEIGIVGGILLILVYIAFLWRGLVIAKNAPDMLGRLLAAGITLWITFDAFLNMGVMVNLFPFAGNALPFISAGGSSMISSLAGIGILMNIARESKVAQSQEGRSFGAVVDLRRRDRRRSVSRPLGAQGTQQ